MTSEVTKTHEALLICLFLVHSQTKFDVQHTSVGVLGNPTGTQLRFIGTTLAFNPAESYFMQAGQGRLWGALFVLIGLCGPSHADDSLAVQIDQIIVRKAGISGITVADDAEFLRRVSLDLTGCIPPTSAVREFLADTGADKRSRKIDQLLSNSDHPRRMQESFHVLLMERLGDHEDWQKYLRASFASNKPWDQMVREMLGPNSEDEATRGSGLFLSKRLENYGQNPVDLPALTRDIGRLFLGVDLQCAQCHDHLFVDDYKQEDFQGLYTFIAGSFVRSDQKFPAVGEKPLLKKTEFMSVFKKEPKSTGPRVPGLTEIEIPKLIAGEEFAVPPDRARNFPGKLKFSPLEKLAEQLPSPNSPQFARNIANRIWALLVGRGIVHPLDLQHSDNPPSHPELLELLSRELVAHQFDLRWLIREICLSHAYQASSQLSSSEEPKAESFTVAIEKPLSAEQMLWSVLQATGELPRLVAKNPEKPIPDDVKQRFLKAFANPPREPEGEFAPSVKAALFLMHDPSLQGWLMPEEGRLIARVCMQTDHNLVVEELYLATLGRLPTELEKSEINELLNVTPDRKEATLRNAIWALIASTEFCVNH